MLSRLSTRVSRPCIRLNPSNYSRLGTSVQRTSVPCTLWKTPLLLHRSTSSKGPPNPPPTNPTITPPEIAKKPLAIRENIYTIPNLFTVSRIIACPVLGLAIVNDNFYFATGLLVYAGLTDLVSHPPSFYLCLRLELARPRLMASSQGDSRCSPLWEPSSILQRTRYS